MSELAVGQYKKVESNTETCEECKNTCPLLFKVANEDTKSEQSLCEGCWTRYYIKHPAR